MAGFGSILGGIVANVGKTLKLPEFGISERLSGQPQAKASTGGSTLGATTKAAVVPAGISPGYNSYGGGGTSYGGGQAASGGQAAAPQGGSSGGNTYAPDQAYLQQLRDAFGGVKQSYENQLGSYDADFNNQKSAADSAIARAKDTLNQQNQQDEVLYGQNLKDLLQSNQELAQRRQGTYSALGSLDSSSFQQDTAKADQSLLDNKMKLGNAKDTALRDRQSQYAAYEQKANTDLAAYGQEIARAKEGLRAAIASTNMNEANSIQQYISGLQQQAQQVAQQQQAMNMNLAQLAAQGVDVVGNLQKTNLAPFTQQFGQGLQSQLAAGQSRYQVPTGQAQGQGFIAGNSSQNDIRKLLGLA